MSQPGQQEPSLRSAMVGEVVHMVGSGHNTSASGTLSGHPRWVSVITSGPWHWHRASFVTASLISLSQCQQCGESMATSALKPCKVRWTMSRGRRLKPTLISQNEMWIQLDTSWSLEKPDKSCLRLLRPFLQSILSSVRETVREAACPHYNIW